jgi:hypothetical protein
MLPGIAELPRTLSIEKVFPVSRMPGPPTWHRVVPLDGVFFILSGSDDLVSVLVKSKNGAWEPIEFMREGFLVKHYRPRITRENVLTVFGDLEKGKSEIKFPCDVDYADWPTIGT